MKKMEDQKATDGLGEFLPLTAQESEVAQKKIDRKVRRCEQVGMVATKLSFPEGDSKIATVKYTLQDPFTYCILRLKVEGKEVIVAGAAKRATYAPIKDNFNLERAKGISFNRAVDNAIPEIRAIIAHLLVKTKSTRIVRMDAAFEVVNDKSKVRKNMLKKVTKTAKKVKK